MADVGSGSWFTPVIALVTALATPILAAFLPRLWQDDLQRLRSVSETRVKRLEALEKALSVTATAKADGIDVTIHDLQRELQQIVHEFAGPAVLSREELEKWISMPFLERLYTRPTFTIPAKNEGSRVRNGLAAGGSRIRTIGPPVRGSIFSRPPRIWRRRTGF